MQEWSSDEVGDSDAEGRARVLQRELEMVRKQSELLTAKLSKVSKAFQLTKAEMEEKLSQKDSAVSELRESILSVSGREPEKCGV